MSDTPRTDAKEWDADLGNMVVNADFARLLERENAELLAALELRCSKDADAPETWERAHDAIRKAKGEA